ncbi:hypothetical protein NDU88_002240 [Pleurodeles waltl]|uniref:Uncharacterized protein n=1 Tax=Pleurodeles waltl TaxID=8319 RepID=A0AAV7TK12_PLEWA|nr:hypothetical protein NDU88_002240 [Pleurodeles waltl]
MLTRSSSASDKETWPSTCTATREDQREQAECDQSPVTKGFLTSLFNSLKSDIYDLRCDLARELCEIRSDLTSAGERVSSMEDNGISHDKDVEVLSQEVICLHEQQDILRA